ncbi:MULTISPECIES: VanW family protein [unclassified Rhodococcus (in: high G+C Gram-positive bacteria)]|uniref:VanW family protein n=1 Tax=unclassified Rhodococcus (in: high G+C Gram-positive bacteria) TaxID=192944 RepID=UPI0024B72FD2|nr:MULTISPECIES: VanW family protein [unclassified Rhodococcus (in: high G+C Gram-positive bacteria)]MDI9957245.1 VanW family protein [Rhodococcus sp. IEGM 1237]MDI9962214.1 VanW family protein [Rhodococcus sp. IEGM 1251]MDV8125402.1 VanW family protein [Rhodococcus sp. IEGM 1304]
MSDEEGPSVEKTNSEDSSLPEQELESVEEPQAVEETESVEEPQTPEDTEAVVEAESLESPRPVDADVVDSAEAADAAVADEDEDEAVDELTDDESANEVTTVIPVVPADDAPPTEVVDEVPATEAIDEQTEQFEPPAVVVPPKPPRPEFVQQYDTQKFEPIQQQYEPVVREPAVVAPPVPQQQPEAPASTSSRKWVKPAIAVGAIFAVAAIAYGVDIFTSSGKTPRGTQVAGVDIGDLTPADAEATLRAQLGPRLVEPVAVHAGGVDSEIVPASAGVDVDWSATLSGVNAQPINPITRITSFFGSREVPVVSTVDQQALDTSMAQLAANSDRAPVEGAVVFENGKATGVSPAAGQALETQKAGSTFAAEWSDGGVVDLPVDEVPVTVTQAGVDRALQEVAIPAVSGDVVVNGRDGKVATLGVDQIGEVLTFTPDGSGGLTPQYNTDAAIKILTPQLVSTEVQPKDASFTFAGGKPSVVPGVVGDLINWPDTVKELPVLLGSTASRATPAVYGPVPPALTTEAAEALGINEVIGEFTTGGFEYASGVNIGLAASEIDGAVIKPGDTFSLNEYTGPRGAAQGYVESGIINNGRPDKAVGGGISQLATTLYNATYFAGMDDVAHTEHSYYISRYPEAREATIFDGAIDLQFRNPAKTGVMIETIATSSNITVRIWGTKTVDVTSTTGPRTSPTSPNTVTLPEGPGCVASSGAPGFTVSDTRVITDHASGAEISSNTRTVKYDPVPIVKCE